MRATWICLARLLAPAVLLAAPAAGANTPATQSFELGSATGPFEAARGFGFDFGSDYGDTGAVAFSVRVPEGNWRVTLHLGDTRHATETTVKAESRRLMLEGVRTAPGETVERSFVVNVRTPQLPAPPLNAPGGDAVRLNAREQNVRHWDDKLTLEFLGSPAGVQRVELAPAPDIPTLFLLGDSTVTDQPHEPAASWGQMLPRFFDATLAVANHAESGETLKSFLTALRFDKVLSQLRAGDYVMLQFGHNDSKVQWPQTFAEAGSTYEAYLRVYLAEIRRRGAHPILLTSVHRRSFDDAGRIRNTHGGYLEAVRRVATAEQVPLIDLAAMSAAFYEALGPEQAPLAFNDGGRDATHHNAYGAYQLAHAVVQSLRQLDHSLAEHLRANVDAFDPARPPSPTSFQLPPSASRSQVRPRGD